MLRPSHTPPGVSQLALRQVHPYWPAAERSQCDRPPRCSAPELEDVEIADVPEDPELFLGDGPLAPDMGMLSS